MQNNFMGSVAAPYPLINGNSLSLFDRGFNMVESMRPSFNDVSRTAMESQLSRAAVNNELSRSTIHNGMSRVAAHNEMPRSVYNEAPRTVQSETLRTGQNCTPNIANTVTLASNPLTPNSLSPSYTEELKLTAKMLRACDMRVPYA